MGSGEEDLGKFWIEGCCWWSDLISCKRASFSSPEKEALAGESEVISIEEAFEGARLKMLFKAEVVEFKSGEDVLFISGGAAAGWMILFK